MMAGWILAGVFFVLWLIEKLRTMTSRFGELMADDMKWRANGAVYDLRAGNSAFPN